MNIRGRALLMSALAVTLFAGCSNATYGFDEDSPFYTEPAAEHEAEKADETPVISEEKTGKREEAPKSEVKEEDPDEENETTFSYDPYGEDE
ncbi:MAG: hypothetical protein MUP09_00865 [Thiovulaceae bacterium]|nr:hypothetical protein [Sulfurimonadaceae bacterium]